MEELCSDAHWLLVLVVQFVEASVEEREVEEAMEPVEGSVLH